MPNPTAFPAGAASRRSGTAQERSRRCTAERCALHYHAERGNEARPILGLDVSFSIFISYAFSATERHFRASANPKRSRFSGEVRAALFFKGLAMILAITLQFTRVYFTGFALAREFSLVYYGLAATLYHLPFGAGVD